MKPKRHPAGRTAIPLALIAVAFLATGPTHAQPTAAPFPPGKPVSLYLGFEPGGGNDQIMRLVARNIGKHLPGNPNVIPRNMPGAGGRRLVGYIYNAAPRDGTELAMVSRAVTTDPLLVDPMLPFSAQDLTWLGAPTGTTDTCIVWHAAKTQSMADLKTVETVIAGTGNEAAQLRMLRLLTGARIRSVVGYPGAPAMNLALERGEADGRCSLSWESIKASMTEWLNAKKIKPIVQFAAERHPELQDVPAIMEFATTERDREALRIILLPTYFGFPFAAPPHLRPEVRTMLRTAFAQTLHDPQFIDEAQKLKLDVRPVRGEDLERAARAAYASSPEAIARAKQLIAPH
jgi:tripartite-type tricarboxylate transporter receptor subunit TctC